MSRQIHEDYPPAEPGDWADEPRRKARQNRAAGFGDGLPRQRRRGGARTYLAIAVLLVLLLGGTYAAYVEKWIDVGSLLPTDVTRTAADSRTDPGQVVFAGNAGELAAPTGNLVQQDKGDGGVTWIRSSLRQARASGATDGASLKIKPPLLTDLVGKRIRVTVLARAPDQGSPAPFAVAYSSANVGTSGWVVFTPTKQFDNYSFEYQVPATVGAAQYVGIWSDISGRGAPLAVRSISISRLN